MSGDLFGSNEARVDTERLCEFEPLPMSCQTCFRVSEIQGAALFETGIRTYALVHCAPSFQRFHNEGNLARGAALLAAPTPVAGGLLRTDFALLAKRDRDTSLGQGKGCTDTDNAAAYDDNLGGNDAWNVDLQAGTGSVQFTWGPCCTDGFAMGYLEGDFCIDFTPTYSNGLMNLLVWEDSQTTKSFDDFAPFSICSGQ